MAKISNRLTKLFQKQLSNNIINIADLKTSKEFAADNLKSINSIDDLIGKGIDALKWALPIHECLEKPQVQEASHRLAVEAKRRVENEFRKQNIKIVESFE